MRTIDSRLAASLAGDATTLCSVWIVRRADGAVFGFTDHDRPIEIDGVSCQPGTGFDRTSASRNSDFSVGEEEISGALSSDVIAEADIAAGLWDGASIEVRLVDWTNPSANFVQRTGTIGEITASDGAFKAEVRGPAHRLDQPVGRLYSRFCDAGFADARCRLAASDWTVAAHLADGSTDRILVVDEIADKPAGWFGGGLVTFADGALAGRTAEIDAHLRDELGVRLTLKASLTSVPEAGATVSLLAGCDKRFETCRDRFANEDNFRGFPHIPGRDFVFSFATGDGTESGEVLF